MSASRLWVSKAATWACEITVDGDPFEVPWKLELRRPGQPPYRAECRVFKDKTASGEPLIRVAWKEGHRHRSPEREILQQAFDARLEDALPADHDLVRLGS